MNDKMAADPARDDLLILVDETDRELGTDTKRGAHEKGSLHRAFSVVLVREGESGPEVLLVKRAHGKYHSGGLWTNSCCSHPRAGEELEAAVLRRMPEELGCEADELREIGAFVYRAEFDNGLTEHEFDHVFLATSASDPVPDPEEAEEIRWITPDELERMLEEQPGTFTAWAPQVLRMALAELG